MPPTLLSESDLVARAELAQRVRSGVYFLIRDGRVVYVGKTKHIDARIAKHAEHRQFDSWTWLPCPVNELEAVERAYLNALLPEGNLDPITLRLKGGNLSNPIPIPENPWESIPKAVWDAALTNSVDDENYYPPQVRQTEWMRRLRAIKADARVTLKDFGVSPFSQDWSPEIA